MAKDINKESVAETVNVDLVLNDMKILDLGKNTIINFQGLINESATVIWNGPMGLYEYPQFEDGTKEIAFKLSNSHITTIIGGGDTIDAINKFGIPLEKFTHISTGGGAMLEFWKANFTRDSGFNV